MLKKDSIWLGIAIGLASPLLFLLLLTGVNYLIGVIFEPGNMIRRETTYLLCIFINLLPIRLYFVNFKSDKTGRGVLLITFLMMVVYFAFIKPA